MVLALCYLPSGLVERCCDPLNREPNLALNLELADYIKQKKANA